MRTVSFTQMKDGTREDYLLLREAEEAFQAMTPDRLLRELAQQGEDSIPGYKITRLDHSLQAATRAQRDGADADWVVSALLHDIGDGLAPQNHDRFAAEIIRPYVREECTWVIEHHGLFQTVYFGHHYGWDPNARDEHKSHPYYQSCVDFCERWDQNSFDDEYENLPLSFFEPLLREVFARKAYAPDVVRAGAVVGLPPV